MIFIQTFCIVLCVQSRAHFLSLVFFLAPPLWLGSKNSFVGRTPCLVCCLHGGTLCYHDWKTRWAVDRLAPRVCPPQQVPMLRHKPRCPIRRHGQASKNTMNLAVGISNSQGKTGNPNGDQTRKHQGQR